MNYVFHPIAEKEHLDSVAFYETKRAGLGLSYLSEFEGAMAAVCKHPRRYPVEEQPDIRRVRLDRFPYNILYRENHGVVQVLAVAHKRRMPTYWVNRL